MATLLSISIFKKNLRQRKGVFGLTPFAIALTAVAAAGCQSASVPASEDWAAHGFMAPGPVGESEVIGIYFERDECEQAAADWMARQVAGNPVFADCYPIDKN